MNITLISPYFDIHVLGIRTISACLKAAGHDVSLIFLPQDFTERYETKILDQVVSLSKDANLIGISLMTNYYDNAVQLTQALKKETDAPILWGGIHPTIRPEECLKFADMVCVGEGDGAVVELTTKMEKGEDFYGVAGIWFKDNDRIIRNPTRPLIQDLDAIPFPDYDFKTHHILHDDRIQKLDEELANIHSGSAYMTMSTRGCPFGCTYCCNSTFNKMYPEQKILRKRGIEKVIEELAGVREALPFIDRILLADDVFLSRSLAEIEDFCTRYKRQIGLPFFACASPTTITRDKIRLLVDAGLYSIVMGLQTGSERTKQQYNRRYRNQQVVKAANILNEFSDKLNIAYDILLDNPWETKADLTKTLILLSKLPTPFRLHPFSLTFYPETGLYRQAQEDGLICDDLNDTYRKNFVGCKKTHLNDLFYLLSDHAAIGANISTRTMYFMAANKLGPCLKLLLRLRLRFMYFPSDLRRLFKWLQQGMSDLKRKDLSRLRLRFNRLRIQGKGIR